MYINIIEYLQQTVSNYPDKIAVIDGNRTITFSQLNIRSKQIGTALIKEIGEINVPIGVFLPKSLEAIIVDIAISYSGNCYMNLDIKNPTERLKNIIERISPKVIITDSNNKSNIQMFSENTKLLVFEDLKVIEEIDEVLLRKQIEKIIDLDPICIINTSGSTGTPKGAVLNHRSYIDYTQWAIRTFNFLHTEVLGVLSPIIFDHYNYEICLMMTVGCTLVLLDNQMATFPVRILESLVKNNVTYIFWVPSIMVNIANMYLLSRINLNKIRMVWFAGEVFPTKQFNYWRKHLPQAVFVNLYGPVETSVDCTYYIINRELRDDEPIPIGFPCRNTNILILNQHNMIAKTGEEGELCVRGTSLAMGYYNNPEKTQEVFIQNPLNHHYPELIYRTGDVVAKNDLGEIIFKGRKDTLIKHLGYRIELGEIEHVIVNKLKLVETACAIYNFAEKEINLFYASKVEYSVRDLKKKIGEFLPKYMVPTVFHQMEELPRNTNGKIDRLFLSKLINDEKS